MINLIDKCYIPKWVLAILNEAEWIQTSIKRVTTVSIEGLDAHTDEYLLCL